MTTARAMLLAISITACSGPAAGDDAGTDAAEPVDVGTDAARTPRDAGPPLGLPPLDCSRDNCWQFAVLSDTHVIDEWYMGPESNELDTSSILMANERLRLARDRINTLAAGGTIDFALLAGDVIHQYASDDPAFYTIDPTASMASMALAHDLLAGFSIPVYLALGNHDYDVPGMTREDTSQLFRDIFHTEPYYAITHRGIRFLVLNSQLGDTWDPASPRYDTGKGSLGAEQLAWIEDQLGDGVPSILVLHHQPFVLARDEVPGATHPDLFAITEAYPDLIRLVISGHMHRWWDYGTMYGARQITMGSTRYDEDAFLVFRADEESGDIELLNPGTPVWHSVDANRYEP
jgi:3',5'-cyclic AMP phosphodiesterase CpdA